MTNRSEVEADESDTNASHCLTHAQSDQSSSVLSAKSNKMSLDLNIVSAKQSHAHPRSSYVIKSNAIGSIIRLHRTGVTC